MTENAIWPTPVPTPAEPLEIALMSAMMHVAARESALQQGRRVALPLEGDVEADAFERERQRSKYGVDPMDVEAMLAARPQRA